MAKGSKVTFNNLAPNSNKSDSFAFSARKIGNSGINI